MLSPAPTRPTSRRSIDHSACSIPRKCSMRSRRSIIGQPRCRTTAVGSRTLGLAQAAAHRSSHAPTHGTRVHSERAPAPVESHDGLATDLLAIRTVLAQVLSDYSHFASLAVWNVYSIEDEEQRLMSWSTAPRWRYEERSPGCVRPSPANQRSPARRLSTGQESCSSLMCRQDRAWGDPRLHEHVSGRTEGASSRPSPRLSAACQRPRTTGCVNAQARKSSLPCPTSLTDIHRPWLVAHRGGDDGHGLGRRGRLPGLVQSNHARPGFVADGADNLHPERGQDGARPQAERKAPVGAHRDGISLCLVAEVGAGGVTG